jgi:hypothetical protein
MFSASKGIIGIAALSLTVGAVQLASGHDLIGGRQTPSDTLRDIVNRTAKADRASAADMPSAPTATIALHFDSLADTSVLVRIPQQKKVARERPATPVLMQSRDRKPSVACEPVVSVLTEVAKQLEPGRCVT